MSVRCFTYIHRETAKVRNERTMRYWYVVPAGAGQLWPVEYWAWDQRMGRSKGLLGKGGLARFIVGVWGAVRCPGTPTTFTLPPDIAIPYLFVLRLSFDSLQSSWTTYSSFISHRNYSRPEPIVEKRTTVRNPFLRPWPDDRHQTP